MNLKKKKEVLAKRRFRIRKKIIGTEQRPRLTVHFSNKHIYAQCINDASGTTLCSLSTLSKDFTIKTTSPNIVTASALGKDFGVKIKTAGFDKVVFDRNGRSFHGAVKAFSDAARESITF